MLPIIFRNPVLFFLFFAISFSTFAQKKSSYNPNKKFSPQELKADFYFLRSAIQNFHAGANWYISADSLTNLFDNYEKTLSDSLTERQFRNQLYGVNQAIKCGHSGISSSIARQKYFKKKTINILPFDLYYIDSQIVVMRNLTKDSTIKSGSIIKSIESISAEKIVQTMFEANSSDGYNLTNRYFSFERGLQFEYTRYFTEKDSFRIELQDSTKTVRLLKVAAIFSDSFPFVKPTVNKTLLKNRGNYFFLSEKDSTIAILDLQSEQLLGYKKFYKKSFKYLKKNHLDKLVIDLRGNGGGFLLNPGNLLSYLIPNEDFVEVIRVKKELDMKKTIGTRKWVRFTEVVFPWLPNVKRVRGDKNVFHLKIFFKPQRRYFYDGKVFVLIDGGTFSAASYIAAYLKKYNRATFIGKETGGGEAGCNAFLMPNIELPNTKLQYRLPLYRVKHNTSPKRVGRGIEPDILIHYNKDNLLKNNDLEMKEVFTLHQY